MPVELEILKNSVARIHLNNPKTYNSLSPEDSQNLLDQLKQCRDDQAVRVVVFSGEGKHFSSGADLKAYDSLMNDCRTGKRSIADLRHIYTILTDIHRVLRDPNLLSIAAPQGTAAGQGLELCIGSDFTVASDDAKFYFAETQVGAIMTSGMGKLLPQMVGLGNARRLMLFGEKLEMEEAKQMGLVTQVVPKGQQVEVAIERAERLAAGAPLALAIQKRILDAQGSMDLSSVQEFEASVATWIGLTHDAVEAGQAFLEKRPPEFKGF